MIRGKLVSSDTGAGSPIAVSTVSGYQNADADSRFNESMGGDSNSKREYMLLDANGTAWEYGLGRQIGTNFYRDQIIESTNSEAAIVLTVGTHTILLPSGGLKGSFVSQRFNGTASPGAANFATFSWTTVNNSVDNANDLPGGSSPSLPTSYPLGNNVPYWRALQVHIAVTQDTVTASNFINVYGVNENHYGTRDFGVVLPTDDTSFNASCSSPILCANAPIGTSSTYGQTAGDWQVNVENPGAARTVSAVMTIDYFL